MIVPRSLSLFALVSVVVVGMSSPAAAQAPPMPKPGPEHEVLKMDVGTWDAEVEAMQGPGAPPAKSKGVEVSTLGCGGLCLITDFKGEIMPGVSFQGHGLTVWDAHAKKYRGSWSDSTSMGLMVGESTWDAAAKKATGTMEGPDMTGQVVKMRSVVEYPSPTQRVMTAYAPGPDGKEMQVLKITYTKRK